MSRYGGLLMIFSGTVIFLALSLKLLFQPFIPKEHYIHSYFPSTEIVLGIPILFGTAFFVGFGIYIARVLLKDNVYNNQ